MAAAAALAVAAILALTTLSATAPSVVSDVNPGGLSAVLGLAALAWLLGRDAGVRRERDLREAVERQNSDLEALAQLATTMTETLDEDRIVERGLGVLHLAGKATGAALQLRRDGRLVVVARSGGFRSGGEGMARMRLPVVARQRLLGEVVLERPATRPFADDDMRFLRIIADQLAIGIQNARDHREKAEQAVRDPLTGLYNRRYLVEALGGEVQRVRRYGSSSSLILVDVDNFKSINDTLGHEAGDTALAAIARIAAGLVREVDIVARVGGEEFALLLPETDQMGALLVAERLRAAIEGEPILFDRTVTVSAGVASCPGDGRTREEIMRRADRALYWSKGNGRNICALASDVTDAATRAA